MSSRELNISDYCLQVAGDLQLTSAGEFCTVFATGDDALLSLRGAGSVVAAAGCAMLTLDNDSVTGGIAILQAGLTGQVKLGVGVPELGASVTLEPQAIKLQLGPPGVGSSISMTPDSITFKVAETSFKLTPTGIVEQVLECSREHGPLGHTLVAAETNVNIGVAGVTSSMPMSDSTAEAGLVASQTLATISTDAAKQEQAAVTMLT